VDLTLWANNKENTKKIAIRKKEPVFQFTVLVFSELKLWVIMATEPIFEL